MTDLTPHHPAVEAAERAATRWMEARELETDLDGTAYMLTAALPHLESATEENLARLRNTPAGKQLLAEGWEAACRKVIHMAWADSSDAEYLADEGNPYRTEAPQ